MRVSLATAVRVRAKGRCEYCRFPESQAPLAFPLDHVIAVKHHGPTTLDNLALACPSCNGHKGPSISGIDPESGRHMALFNPRVDRWHDHFRWNGVEIVGLTPVARATIDVLAMNDEFQLAARVSLVRSGWFFRADL